MPCNVLSSHFVTKAVLSTLEDFTFRFGMLLSVSLLPLPQDFIIIQASQTFGKCFLKLF